MGENPLLAASATIDAAACALSPWQARAWRVKRCNIASANPFWQIPGEEKGSARLKWGWLLDWLSVGGEKMVLFSVCFSASRYGILY